MQHGPHLLSMAKPKRMTTIIDLPISMAPTAEALLDQGEIDKYCFNDDMLREATEQLSSQFNHPEEPCSKDFGEPTEMSGGDPSSDDHSNTAGMDQGLAAPQGGGYDQD